METKRVNKTEEKLIRQLRYLGLYYDFDGHSGKMYEATRIHSILRAYYKGNYSVEDVMKLVRILKIDEKCRYYFTLKNITNYRYHSKHFSTV